MEEKKVSIIIPIYNTEKYLESCIRSAFSQTYGNIEIILVDDGSTDSSGEICRRYAKLDGRIKYLPQKNGGEGAARNAGLAVAEGEFVTFLDSDDELPPDAVETLVNASEGVGMVIGGFRQVSGETVPKEKIVQKPQFGECVVGEDYVFVKPICSKLFRMEIIERIALLFNDFVVGEDCFFVFQYMQHIDSIHFIDKPVYFNNIVDGSMSRRVVHGIWPISEALYFAGKNILSGPEENYLLFLTEVKSAFINEYRCSKREFMDTFKNAKLLLEKEREYMRPTATSIYNRLVYRFVEKDRKEMAWMLFKIRVWMLDKK